MNSIDGSNSRPDCCRGFTAMDTTQQLGNHKGPTGHHFKTMCECCGKECANAMASTPIFVVIASNGEYAQYSYYWVVAVYENEQDATDHMAAAQAVADSLLEAYIFNLVKDADLRNLKNEYDPCFWFEPSGVRYEVECHELFKTGQGLEAVKKWAAEY